MQRKKKTRFPWIWLLGAAVILALLIFGLTRLISPTTSGAPRVVTLSALPGQQIIPFGDRVVYYDGMLLNCADSSGSIKWSFQVGVKAGSHVGGNRVVAWSANQLYVLNKDGKSTYNDKMAGAISFARVSDAYVAAYVGQGDTGAVYVLDSLGAQVDVITVEGQTLLDIGFFQSEGMELMWVLGLDTSGTVPSTTLQTFRPGSRTTGNSVLGESLVYKISFHDKHLRVADTRQIRFFNYKVQEDVNYPPVLVYGWYLQDAQRIGKDMAELLVPVPQIDGQLRATDLRLLMGDVNKVLHLPAECFSAALGTKSVYGFSSQYIYSCKYGENAFTGTPMPVEVNRFLGMMKDNVGVFANNSQVYLIQLP